MKTPKRFLRTMTGFREALVQVTKYLLILPLKNVSGFVLSDLLS